MHSSHLELNKIRKFCEDFSDMRKLKLGSYLEEHFSSSELSFHLSLVYLRWFVLIYMIPSLPCRLFSI